MDWIMVGNAVLTLLFVVLTAALILIILVQRPQGGGLSGAFGAGGGASTQSAFGAKTGDVLTIVTCSIFVLLLVTGSLLVGLQKHAWGSQGVRVDPPAAPGELSVSYQSDGNVELKWKDNSANEQGFHVNRALMPAGPDVEQDEPDWIEVGTVEINETRFLDEGPFEDGRTYSYQIVGYNIGGESDPSGSQDVVIADADAVEPGDGDAEAGAGDQGQTPERGADEGQPVDDQNQNADGGADPGTPENETGGQDGG